MALPVVAGAVTMCTMGLAPGQLMVLPKNRTMVSNRPAANISDNVPMVNIMPFMLCNSLANPVTAAQTAAALGVLTPGTCIPVVPAPWTPGSPTVTIGGMPALTNSSTCICAYGGQISITFGGAVTTTVA
jgi:hypothetical protein